MGTTWSVKLAELPRGVAAEELQSEIDALLELVNDQMSTYRPGSELSRFNSAQTTEWFPVSAETASTVTRAIEIGRRADGALDVTVGPLVDLWGFGSDPRPGRVPSVDELSAAREIAGLDRLQARLDPPALRKADPRMRVDLSAIAKGDGVDRVGALLDARGLSAWLVEIGGEMSARGRKRSDDPWTIAIEKPISEGRAIATVLPLEDLALATSGDYRNFFEENGIRYSHTIDPRTGAPIRHGLASVSVFAATCRDADGWATALDVLGPDQGYDRAVEEDLAALFFVREAGGFREIATPAYLRRFGVAP